MEDSTKRELLNFLKEYNLIQADINDETALEYLNELFNQLNEEDLLSGFIAKLNTGDDVEDRLFIITQDNKLYSYPENQNFQNGINLENTKSIKYNEDNDNEILLDVGGKIYTIGALNEEGRESLNDSLYSSLSEILPEDKVNAIFDETSEYNDDEPVDIVEATVVEEPEVETDNSDNSLITFTTSNEIAPVSQETKPVKKTTEKPEKSPEKDNNKKQFKIFGKEISLSKPVLYTICGIGILALILIVGLIWTTVSNHSQNQNQGKELINYLNELDDIYYTAREYQANGRESATVEDWQDLENRAQDIMNQLVEFKNNDLTSELKFDLTSYCDSLLAALYYGKTYTTTGNSLQESSLESTLSGAYSYRLQAIYQIDTNFPNLKDTLTNPTDLDEDEAAYPQKEEILQKEAEANSKPTDNIVEQENSKSSNEARENSLKSKE